MSAALTQAPPVTAFRAGCVIRGQWIEDDLLQFGGRGVGITFLSPDPQRILPRLPLGGAQGMADLYALSFDDILDYIERLGARLRLADNVHLQQALEASCLTSSLTRPLLQRTYESLPHLFNARFAREMADNTVGIPYLEGWVPKTLLDGRTVSIRAFGARALHIIAGNSPFIAALSVLRNAVTRGDAIIKSPSNDPFTALAIARTMIELDARHPLTRHLSVAYWKGGDEAFESRLYQPRNIEKIVAWGGFASVKHVTRYIQPGLELISLDPKRSVSIVGAEAFDSEASMRDVGRRLATDIGAINQEGCVNARVIYVLSGSDEAGLSRLDRLAHYTYEAMMALPPTVSTAPKEMDEQLRSLLNAARLNAEWYHVVGGLRDEGAIVVSRLPEPVDFAARLGKRVANLVPIDGVDEVYAAVDAYTQTVGVYPESLKIQLRDRLALYGAQRFTSLGYAAHAAVAAPQDAIESTRELCKWVVCEDCDPAVTPPLWEDAELFKASAA
ncbi:MAG: long-chain-fatty-acyl-CoA reductase [Nevskia sp.]|nr:long-chain-fatty-acyl-CoA reductase [Nevskia sp.]